MKLQAFLPQRRSAARRLRAASLIALLAASLSSACGDASKGTSPLTELPPGAPPTKTLLVTFGPELSAAAKARVAQLVTPIGASAIGGGGGDGVAVRVPADPPRSLVIAVDAEGMPLLSAYAGGVNDRLDAASTAGVLVRFALGPPATHAFNAEAFDAAVAKASSYSALVAAIAAAVEGGRSPAEDPDARHLAAAVGAEIVAADPPATAAASLGQHGEPLAASGAADGPVYVTGSPFDVLRSRSVPFGISRLRLEDVTGPGVTVFNTTLVDWEAGIAGAAGDKIGEAMTIKGFSFDPYKLLTLAGLPEPIAVLGNDQRFTITFRQTDQTRGTNALNVVFQSLLMVFEFAAKTDGWTESVPLKCTKEIAEVFLTPELSSLVAHATGEAALEYGKSVVLAGRSNIKPLVDQCSGGAYWMPPTNAEAFFKAVFTYGYPMLDRAFSAADKGAVATLAWQTAEFWQTSVTVTVCKHRGAIGECVARVEVRPAPFAVAPGSSAQLTAKVTGIAGGDLSRTAKVVWSTSDNTIATVDETGRVTGVRNGVVAIKATSGGVSGSGSVTVREALLVPVDLVGTTWEYDLTDADYAPGITLRELHRVETGSPNVVVYGLDPRDNRGWVRGGAYWGSSGPTTFSMRCVTFHYPTEVGRTYPIPNESGCSVDDRYLVVASVDQPVPGAPGRVGTRYDVYTKGRATGVSYWLQPGVGLVRMEYRHLNQTRILTRFSGDTQSAP